MGLATAKLLSSRGAIISLADLNELGLMTAVKLLSDNEKHMYTIVDVRNSQEVEAWIKATVQRLGRLDGAVNMAGIIRPATPVAQMTDEDWDFSFNVNARGVFACIRAEIKAMSAGGSIVSYCAAGLVLEFAKQQVIGVRSKCIWTIWCSR